MRFETEIQQANSRIVAENLAAGISEHQNFIINVDTLAQQIY